MADIDIERRSGSSWWLWLLGLLLLALLAWALLEWMDDDEPEVAAVVDPAPVVPVVPVVTDPAAPMAAATPAAVSTYLSQCTETQGAEPAEMGAEHQFTINCMQQLREALNAMVTQQQVANTDVSGQMDRLTGAVQQLQASPVESTQHANLTRAAAERAAQVLGAMQTAWFGAETPIQGAATSVEQSAQGIQTTVPMLEQRESVRTFFRDAGNALRLMAERGGAPAAM